MIALNRSADMHLFGEGSFRETVAMTASSALQ